MFYCVIYLAALILVSGKMASQLKHRDGEMTLHQVSSMGSRKPLSPVNKISGRFNFQKIQLAVFLSFEGAWTAVALVSTADSSHILWLESAWNIFHI